MLYFRHRNNKPMDSKMSCYQLPDNHHASIAKYVQAQLGWPADKTQQFADRLKHCNVESVNYAHNEEKPAFRCKMNNFKTLNDQSYYDAICHWSYQSDENPNCLDYDIIESFLFSLVPEEFSIDKSIDHTVII